MQEPIEFKNTMIRIWSHNYPFGTKLTLKPAFRT